MYDYANINEQESAMSGRIIWIIKKYRYLKDI